jgi:hypothetical protein
LWVAPAASLRPGLRRVVPKPVRARVEDQADPQVERSLFLGATQNAVAQLVVDSEARVVVAEDAVIGLNGGNGTLTLRGGATLSSAGDVYLFNADTSSGNLNIGAAATFGVLDAPMIEFSLGTATLVFNHTDTDYVFSAGLDRGRRHVWRYN